MDSLTHIALGACIGELFLGKKVGRKAMLYGAVAASLPDIDFLAAFWLPATENLLAHRGITHSILFAVVATALISWLLKVRHVETGVSLKTWTLFIGTAFASHLLLDSLNAYGIGWFEPFTHQRISFNVIFVADPFFSIFPGVAVIWLLFNRRSAYRVRWAAMALVFSSMYLAYCFVNKASTDQAFRKNLGSRQIRYQRYFTTPTSFNNWLWYVVAEVDSGYFIGYHSVFDRPDYSDLHFFPRNASMLKPFENRKELQHLLRFSQGYYVVQNWDGKVVFNDLRFEQSAGWMNYRSPFVFHFFMDESESNLLVVQRGRFSNWNRHTIGGLIRRIRGD